MSLPWRPRFAYGATDVAFTLPVRPWDFLEHIVGGDAESAANVMASFVVRRDQQLALPLRFYEDEWPEVRALIEYGQTGLPIEWFPEVDDVDLSFDIYLDAPEIGDQYDAEPDGEYPRALSLTLVVRRVDGLGWENTLPGYFGDLAYDLVEVSTGLLARHEYDNATFPFSLAHWTAHAGLTLSLSGGALRGTMGVAGALRAARYNPVAIRSKMWIQSVMRGVTVVTNNLQPAPVGHLSIGASPDDYVRYCFSISRPTTDLVALQEIVNAASTVSTTQNITTRTVAVDHRVDLFLDGADAEGYDHTGDIEKAIIPGTLASGQPGIGLNSGGVGGVADWRRFFVMSDRVVTVTGLPLGSSVRVLNGAAVVLGEADAVDGSAEVTLWKKVVPAATVEVYGQSGALLGSLTPALGVWGGSQFRLEEV